MKTIFYIATFTIAATIGSQADQAYRTLEVAHCDVKINVPTAIYAEALDAGVVAWLAAQCTYAPLTSPRPVVRPWGMRDGYPLRHKDNHRACHYYV